MANLALEVLEFALKNGRPAAIKKFGLSIVNKIDQIKDNKALTSIFDKISNTPASASRRINKGMREGKITDELGEGLKEAHEARRYNQAEAARKAAKITGPHAEAGHVIRDSKLVKANKQIRKGGLRGNKKNITPKLAKGGMYKGKPHMYVAGGKVMDTRRKG
tara:strand:- start:4 stop:492 length:489 start_codon:yes stop_codon:yes gene_type:complete